MGRLNFRDSVGEVTLRRARKTRPGVMAAILNEILYNAAVRELDVHKDLNWEYFYVHNEQSQTVLTDLHKLFGVEFAKRNKCDTYFDAKVDVNKFLREVRDYLEFMSFDEVIR